MRGRLVSLAKFSNDNWNVLKVLIMQQKSLSFGQYSDMQKMKTHSIKIYIFNYQNCSNRKLGQNQIPETMWGISQRSLFNR